MTAELRRNASQSTRLRRFAWTDKKNTQVFRTAWKIALQTCDHWDIPGFCPSTWWRRVPASSPHIDRSTRASSKVRIAMIRKILWNLSFLSASASLKLIINSWKTLRYSDRRGSAVTCNSSDSSTLKAGKISQYRVCGRIVYVFA